MSSQTFTGARARFKVSGQKVGFAAGVSGEESLDMEPIDVLDLIEVLEHVPVAYRANLNAQMFRLVGQSLKALGIFPRNEALLTSGALDASIEDNLTGVTPYAFQGVRAQNRSFDAPARGPVNENLAFVAIRVFDESRIN